MGISGVDTSTPEMPIHNLGGWIFSEGFPDLVAYATYGKVDTIGDQKDFLPELRALFSRNLDVLRSYDEPIGEFLSFAFLEKAAKVCSAHSNDSVHTEMLCRGIGKWKPKVSASEL